MTDLTEAVPSVVMEPGGAGDSTGSTPPAGQAARKAISMPEAVLAGGEAEARRRRTARFSQVPAADRAAAAVREQRREFAEAMAARRARDRPRGVVIEEVSATSVVQAAEPVDMRINLTTVGDVISWLASVESRVCLVGFEFSGALSEQLLAVGRQALTCDPRRSEGRAPHYQGEVQDIITLADWEVIFLVGPPCYQQMRRDEYLPQKIADGRAWWAVALVWWCICRPHSLTEQPNTIAHDFADAGALGARVVELRTSRLGDEADKFMRLTLSGVEVDLELPCGAEDGGASSTGGALGGAASSTSTAATLTAGAWLDRQPGGRSQFNYASADERDRARSSWKPYPLLCARVAGARRADGEEGVNRRAAFEDVIERVAVTWWERGYPLPSDYDNRDARPTRSADRAYASERGEGDGRKTLGVTPHSRRAGVIKEARAEGRDDGPDADTTDDDQAQGSAGGDSRRQGGLVTRRIDSLRSTDVTVVVVDTDGDRAEVLAPRDGDTIHTLPNAQAAIRGWLKPRSRQCVDASMEPARCLAI